jgi:hypothetical protein
MSRLTDRLERDLRDIAAGADPSPSAWESILTRLDEEVEPEVALVPGLASVRPKRLAWLAVAAAVLVVIAGSIAVFMRVGDDESISTDFPDLTTTFVSPRNGYSVNYFARGEGTVTPAGQLWGTGQQGDVGFDVVETGLAAVFKGTSTEPSHPDLCFDSASAPTPCGSMDERIDLDVSDGGCGVPRSQQEEITIDEQSGRVAECPNHIEATVLFGGRLYLFTLSHDRSDARSVFDAFVATIDLTPATAVDFPGLTKTFVSPTYGYSFGYIGGLTPAKERWDPDNQPVEDVACRTGPPPAGRTCTFDPRFDAVETGRGAYLEGASTPIPDGISIDGWVDQYATPRAVGACGVPRSQQAKITIDGHSGRIAQCQDEIDATVVAGGRLYLFTLYRSSHDARKMLDAWIATINLTPETAAVP